MNRTARYVVLPLLGVLLFISRPGLAETDAREIYRQNEARVIVLRTHFNDRPLGNGSAFVAEYQSHKYLITNYHVISHAQIYVETAGSRIDDLSVLHVSEQRDIAILTFPGIERLGAVPLSTYEPEQGERVFAMGFPFVPGTQDVSLTITDGLVSNRSLVVNRFGEDTRYIQISAALNGGNSGGPVFGQEGRFIGMATGVFRDMQATNVAVPAAQIIEEIGRIQERPVSKEEATLRLRSRFDFISSVVRAGEIFRFGSFYSPNYKLHLYPEVLEHASRVYKAHQMAASRGYGSFDQVLAAVDPILTDDELMYYLMIVDYYRIVRPQQDLAEVIFRTSMLPSTASEFYLSGRFYYLMHQQAHPPEGQQLRYQSYTLDRIEYDTDLLNARANITVHMEHGSFPIELRFRYEWGNWFLMPSYDYPAGPESGNN